MQSQKLRRYFPSLLLVLSLTRIVPALQPEEINGVYRGILGSEQIVLEMGIKDLPATQDGKHDEIIVVGRYFFRRFGGTTDVKGILLGDGSVKLADNEPRPGENEFRLRVRGNRAEGIFWEYDASPAGTWVTQFTVSLTRISSGFNSGLPRVPEDSSAADQAYYDLILDSPLKRSREIRLDKQTAYVMQGDPRFPGRMPLLTRFPDRKIMAKVNEALTRELNQRRLLDSGCVMGRRFDDSWWEKNSVTFLGRDILSLVRETRGQCASGMSLEILNYDLRSGKSLDLNDIFRIQREGAAPLRDEQLPIERAFLPFVDLYIKYAIAIEGDCKNVVSRDGYMNGPLVLNVYFTREGLVLSPALFPDDSHCGNDELIPYSEIRGLVRSDAPFRTLVKLTRSKSPISPLVYVARSLQLFHQDEFSGQEAIPPRVRYLQRRFKHELRSLIGRVFNQSGNNETLQEKRQAILKKLRVMGILEGFKEDLPDYTYGHLLDVKLDRVQQHPDFLAVAVITDASWAEEESLYIFQHELNLWRNVLSAEVNDYPTAWDAQSSLFNYAISPSSPDGSWFLVTWSVNPHMASAWQHVTYTALSVGYNPDHPKILVRRRHTIYLAGWSGESETACHIKISANGFRLSFVGGYSADQEIYTDEYRVSKGAARRVAFRCRTHDAMGRRAPCSDPD